MADPEQAGTPGTPPADGEGAGTAGGSGDGSEGAGKPVDFKLAMSWKQSAERLNETEARARAAEERLSLMERQLYQQQADPLTQRVMNLQQQAALGDVDATGELQALMATATQQKELELTDAMMDAQVPQNHWTAVKAKVRQSGYRVPVAQALAEVRGSVEAPALQDRLKAIEEENARLKAQLESGRTPGSGKPPAPPPPAVGGLPDGEGPVEMEHEEYLAALAAGGPRALALRNRGVRIKR